MRHGKTCSLWILAMVASACNIDYRLGEEGTGGSAGIGGAAGAAGAARAAGGSAGHSRPTDDSGPPSIDGGGPKPDADRCAPATYYGPQPCQTDSQCVQRYGSGWYCDQTNAYSNGCGETVVWPACKQSVDDGGGHLDAATEACRPAAFYGPQPCETDSQCVQRNGSGWYCDTANSYSDGCGGKVVWPACKQSVDDGGGHLDAAIEACKPAAFYGPQPCETDSQCVQRNGSGWYCDTANSYSDGCGGKVVWPACKQQSIDAGGPDAKADACGPATYYGPPPCTSNSACVQSHGAGWYCDTNHKYDTGCETVSWPICKSDQ